MTARVGRSYDQRRGTRMPTQDRELLRESLPLLWEKITLSDDLVLQLASRGAITEEESHTITRGDRSNSAKFYELLGFLLEGDSGTLDKFIYALYKFEDPAIVNELLREPAEPDIWDGQITTESEVAISRSSSANSETPQQALFEEQARVVGLNPASIDVLVKNDYDNAETVSTITNEDLQQLPLSMGQKGLLRKWVAQLQAKQAKLLESEEVVAEQSRRQLETKESESDQPDEGLTTNKKMDTTSLQKTGREVSKVMSRGKTASQYSNAWKAPMCLINGEDCKLEVNEDAIEALAKVAGPMVIVGVVGLYRTGKSFILNLLAGRTDGFPLGPSTIACTKGIWVWLVEHPTRKGSSLLLLDTEGLGDVKKGNKNHDMWIFTLNVLLSSTMVYNSKCTIDDYALAQLHFVTKVAEHVKVKTDEKDDRKEFASHFPSFIWAVRDFTLELDERGPEGYLEGALELDEGESDSIEEYNQPRKCISEYFPSRTCFCFPFPLTDTRGIRDLESLKENQLAEDFREVSREFKEYIFEKAKPKLVQNQKISGTMFGGMVKAYVEALKKGEAPCIQSVVQTTAIVENTKAIEESLDIYKTRMRSSVKLPTKTLEVLSRHHAVCETEAIEVFLKQAVFDSDHTFQKQLLDKIMSEKRKWCRQNEETSLEKCEQILEKQSKIMREKLQHGDYMVPGGYQIYRSDLSAVESEFNATPNKGVKAVECWDQFKRNKDVEGTNIMIADRNMTEQKKKMEEERNQAEALERERQLARNFTLRLEQEKADEKKSHEENVRQLQVKMGQDRDRLAEELASIRKEQERLKQEGFGRKADDMSRRIDACERDLEKVAEPSLAEKVWTAATYVPTSLWNAATSWLTGK